MGTVVAVCVSELKGTPKSPRDEGWLVAAHGLEGDAHAGEWHRQVSLLPLERIEEFRARGAAAAYGDFGENLVVAGARLEDARVGDRVECGEALLEITQLGKECHQPCRIGQAMGDCIMPRHGVFARVLRGGRVRPGDAVALSDASMTFDSVAVLTVSDRCHSGERVDRSGEEIAAIAAGHGLRVVARGLVPDDRDAIEAELLRLCSEGVALVLTTGGTGFSPRDVTPEATLAVVERRCPGIPEAMRRHGLAHTGRAMLSRAECGIRGRTLIVNLPGSPKAVRESLEPVIGELTHGLRILRGAAGECAPPQGQGRP